MRKVFRIVALIGFPLAAIVWLGFSLTYSPFLRQYFFTTPSGSDFTPSSFDSWECPTTSDRAATQPIVVKFHNNALHDLTYHINFKAVSRQIGRDTQLCSEETIIPSLDTHESTCQVDFSEIETYLDGIYLIDVSAVPKGEQPDYPRIQASYYWSACLILTEEENVRVTLYTVLAVTAGVGLLGWGAALMYHWHWFIGISVLFVLAMILLVLNFVVLDPIPYHHVAWVFEFALIAGVLWWSHRRQTASTDSHTP